MEIDNLQEARNVFNSKQFEKRGKPTGKKQLLLMSLFEKKTLFK